MLPSLRHAFRHGLLRTAVARHERAFSSLSVIPSVKEYPVIYERHRDVMGIGLALPTANPTAEEFVESLREPDTPTALEAIQTKKIRRANKKKRKKMGERVSLRMR
eukprot:TRINITY_DN22161_c0_g1_i2.p2 TRINITY_DN22161_c0_g1~~TRINITY_DN22161_c0_g1_i2.p2  ORF type:complete len:116 (+),score=24.22 TRINITY_DN22161_c0_g1_i2:32-349(+)